jgi:2Fe-2S ferredoxin
MVEIKMPKITFVDFEGTERTVEGSVGDSVMEAANSNDIPGIDADCGGACACATCHVYISEDWMDVVGTPDDLETELLDVAEDVKNNSRLSCQVKVSEEMDGLIVTTPESQF